MTMRSREHVSPSQAGGLFFRPACALIGAALFLAPAAQAHAPSIDAVRGLTLTAVAGQDAFADAVQSVMLGTNGGFGSDLLPGIVLGPPRGGGLLQGSFDVLALGIGGSIVLRFDLPVICDGPGPDFTVFENAFHSGSETGPLFAEYGFVEVSQDGEHFVELPYDPTSGQGLAGRTPVFSNPDNDVSPLDPEVSGGDAFDLADVGLSWAAYVRITDVAGAIRDAGDLPQFTVAPNAGFDLDAVAAVHACDPSGGNAPTPTPTPTPTPLDPTATLTVAEATTTATPPAPTATPTPVGPSATPTFVEPTATATGAVPTPTATPLLPGDLDGDGRVTAADVGRLVAELYEANGSMSAGTGADINEDRVVTAADIVALTARRTE